MPRCATALYVPGAQSVALALPTLQNAPAGHSMQSSALFMTGALEFAQKLAAAPDVSLDFGVVTDVFMQNNCRDGVVPAATQWLADHNCGLAGCPVDAAAACASCATMAASAVKSDEPGTMSATDVTPVAAPSASLRICVPALLALRQHHWDGTGEHRRGYDAHLDVALGAVELTQRAAID